MMDWSPSTGALLWRGFRRCNGPVLTFIGLLVSLLFPLVSTVGSALTWRVEMVLRIGIPAAVIVFIGLLTFLFALDEARSESGMTPRALFGGVEGEAVLCLLEPCSIFSHESTVSFYFIDESGFEIELGVGFVRNVQQDRKIQVQLTSPTQGHNDILQRIANNDSGVLKRLLVKPTIPHRYHSALAGRREP